MTDDRRVTLQSRLEHVQREWLAITQPTPPDVVRFADVNAEADSIIDAGTIEIGETVKLSYVDQSRDDLAADWATLKADVLDRQYLVDLAAAEAAVTAYATYHGLHGAIEWQTPAERFAGDRAIGKVWLEVDGPNAHDRLVAAGQRDATCSPSSWRRDPHLPRGIH